MRKYLNSNCCFNTFVSACISYSFHLRQGSSGNFSSPEYPNITQTKFNYTWIISVPEDHHVNLTLNIPAPLPQAGSCWMSIRDGMFPSSRTIGYFVTTMNVFPAKPWSVFSSGKNLWVNVNTCRFNGRPIICHFSFKAVKTNESKSLIIALCSTFLTYVFPVLFIKLQKFLNVYIR